MKKLSEQDKNRVYKFVFNVMKKKSFDVEVEDAIIQDFQMLLANESKENQLAMISDFIEFVREKVKEKKIPNTAIAMGLKSAKSQGIPDFYINVGKAIFGTGVFSTSSNPEELLKILKIKPGVKQETIHVKESAQSNSKDSHVKTNTDDLQKNKSEEDATHHQKQTKNNSFISGVRRFFETIFSPIILLFNTLLKTDSKHKQDVIEEKSIHDQHRSAVEHKEPKEHKEIKVKPEHMMEEKIDAPENGNTKSKKDASKHRNHLPYPSKMVKTFAANMHLPHIGHSKKHKDTSNIHGNEHKKRISMAQVSPMDKENMDSNNGSDNKQHSKAQHTGVMNKILSNMGLHSRKKRN